jgi:alkanesulfonate monooxygenase SsuD/methylene tetrahydromethanopterin reductase-like flavin-dependent oxidoreductase (luciferase family)
MRVAIGLRLEGHEDWNDAATYVTEAERLGVDSVWSHESWGLDAATPLASWPRVPHASGWAPGSCRPALGPRRSWR